MYFPNQKGGRGGTKTLLLFGDNYFKSFVEHEELIPRLRLRHERHTKEDVRSPVNPVQCVTSLRSPEKCFYFHLGHKVPYSSSPGSCHRLEGQMGKECQHKVCENWKAWCDL